MHLAPRLASLALPLALAALAACGGSSTPAPSGPAAGSGAATTPPAAGEGCIRTGCSGIVCAPAGQDVITTCEYRAEYACYGSATCEPQADGQCGWTQTPELTACLANPPAM